MAKAAMHGSPLPAAVIAELVQLRRQGYSYPEIAARLGVHRHTVRRYCHAELGYTRPACWEVGAEATRLRDAGWSYPRIADYLGYPNEAGARMAVYHYRRRSGQRCAERST